MKQTLPRTAPSFYLTDRQRMNPGAVLLALLLAGAGLYGVAFGLGKGGRARRGGDDAAATRSSGGAASKADDKDDPNQVDTIVLGDAADAPVPARKGDRSKPGDVHPTILIRLPRYGEQYGLIPDTPSGHLLFQWLAAFNQGSLPAMEHILPDGSAPAEAQMMLRKQTGGFALQSAKEIAPGVLVFRLRDQTPESNEVLGTLYMLPESKPPAIGSFSLRAVAVASHTMAATGAASAR